MNHICVADSIEVFKKALWMTEWWLFVVFLCLGSVNLVHSKTSHFKHFIQLHEFVSFVIHVMHLSVGT